MKRAEIRKEVGFIGKLFLVNFGECLRLEWEHQKTNGAIKKLSEVQKADFVEWYIQIRKNIKGMIYGDLYDMLQTLKTTDDWLTRIERKALNLYGIEFSFDSVIKKFEKTVSSLSHYYLIHRKDEDFSKCMEILSEIKKDPNYMQYLECFTKWSINQDKALKKKANKQFKK